LRKEKAKVERKTNIKQRKSTNLICRVLVEVFPNYHGFVCNLRRVDLSPDQHRRASNSHQDFLNRNFSINPLFLTL